jgi:hypothetical protein
MSVPEPIIHERLDLRIGAFLRSVQQFVQQRRSSSADGRSPLAGNASSDPMAGARAREDRLLCIRATGETIDYAIETAFSIDGVQMHVILPWGSERP